MAYFHVKSIRVMRFLYSLGFDKESYIDSHGNEHWRFEKSEPLLEAMDFYKRMRQAIVTE